MNVQINDDQTISLIGRRSRMRPAEAIALSDELRQAVGTIRRKMNNEWAERCGCPIVDGEEWRVIPGCGGRYLFSNQNRVWSNVSKTIIADGYARVELTGDDGVKVRIEKRNLRKCCGFM